MQTAGLDESQAGIKITGRNISNLRYAENTTKEESEKTGLKRNIQKTKIMISGPITSWQTEGGKVEAVMDFIFLGFKNHCGW